MKQERWCAGQVQPYSGGYTLLVKFEWILYEWNDATYKGNVYNIYM